MNTASFPTLVTKVRQFAIQFRYFLFSLVLLNVSPLCGLAQDRHSTRYDKRNNAEQKSDKRASTIVRESTERLNVL
jgi:hypothetical protein